MAPVRRTLEATWMGEGLSVVAKTEGVDENGSSMGPPSCPVEVVSSAARWVSHAHDEASGGSAAEGEKE